MSRFSSRVFLILALPVIIYILFFIQYHLAESHIIGPFVFARVAVVVMLLLLPLYGIIILSLYGMRPALITAEKFFIKQGYANVLYEFNFIKKFLFISISSIIFLNVFYISPGIAGGNDKSDNTSEPVHRSFFENARSLLFHSTENAKFSVVFLQGFIGWISFVGFLRIITQLAKREFRFYFAKACCKVISEKEDEFNNMKYLMLLLDSYNKYLHRTIKMGINNIEKIDSIIYYKDIKERNQIIQSICNCLDDEKLKLTRYLAAIYKVADSEFYVQVSIFQRLKFIGAILAVVIPILISIVQSIEQWIHHVK